MHRITNEYEEVHAGRQVDSWYPVCLKIVGDLAVLATPELQQPLHTFCVHKLEQEQYRTDGCLIRFVREFKLMDVITLLHQFRLETQAARGRKSDIVII